ncbi:MAG: DUF429 domain-containing protein [Betaproteobacteria bacterium]|nr:DUF429 domain-containing protein [Betaproteobacteria bacterium]
MLRATFKHLRGLLRESESRIWQRGIMRLEDYVQPTYQLDLFSNGHDAKPAPLVAETIQAIANKDVEFFANELYPEDWFRVVLEYPNDTIFLDLETTGLSKYYDIVTIVGWSLNSKYHVHIRGQDDSKLRRDLRDASAIVTYNGTLFDIPFLQKDFPGVELPPIHVDLRFAGKRVGLTGGQKDIENQLGLARSKIAQKIQGEIAPVLWANYARGDTKALRRLIAYNHADVGGLQFIFDEVAQRAMVRLGAPESLIRERPRVQGINAIRWSTPTRSSGILIPPFKIEDKKRITATTLLTECGIKDCRVVGIDLTGSAARPTGWSLLNGTFATVKSLSTDEDIIKATLAAKPHLVSIDSPLSLPTGRLSPFDDDPGRKEFGIMRHSERVLKKRGINVYPALIPSMQRLTARGLKLADEFRKLGLAVIESYPGAAQDIMNIPRKRAGLPLLKQGLKEFGIRGGFITKDVTHDELDAITSAIVGLFFFAGRFERLGKDDEESLIIPDLRIDPTAWKSRKVIGFSGPLASGKTTAAKHLESLGFGYGRYSMVLEDELTKRGEQPTRRALQEFGLHVNRELGQRWLGRRLLGLFNDSRRIAIDGMRFPEDHALLIESFGPAFTHVHLQSPVAKRQERYERRDPEGKPFSEADTHKVEHGVNSMKAIAQVKVANRSNLRSFLIRIQKLSKE